MPAFTRRTRKFTHKGMNWNTSVEMIPDGQVCFSRNLRVPQQGQVATRAGISSFGSISGATYIHSMSRLNNYSGNLPFFTFVYVIGRDNSLYVGQNNTDLNNGSINPVFLPPAAVGGGTTSLSGNPLTMVDAMSFAGLSGWKYVGDSTKMMAVGYYPGDTPGTTMARALSMGLLPPVSLNIPTATSGNLTGSYQWAFVFRRLYTGARSNLSAPTRVTLASPALSLSSQAGQIVLPLTPADPQIGPLSHDSNIVIDVYRYGGTVLRWAFVGTGTSGATFVDNLPDVALLAAPSPSQTTDPTTGQTRFNIFQPFPMQDIGRFGTGKATQTANNVWTFQWQSGDAFNAGLLQGSTISINNALFTVYQVRNGGASSLAVIELAGDATGILTSGSTYNWAIPAGQIIMGQPCPHIWGPYGTGITGSYIFGCGNSNAPGTLFWTNGNDPDSSDLANSLVVTSPSEPLKGGCVYNGTPYVWSTERMFQIFPNLSIVGQFYVQEVVGGKGLWMEWSLTVQTNSIADQSISWVGKDGIYNFTPAGGTSSLTDGPLYPMFPHDNLLPAALDSVFPFLASEDANLHAIDYTTTNAKYHRLCWIDGELFYDFPQTGGSAAYGTLVYDAKQAQGWVSLDVYGVTAGAISRTTEIAANNMKVAIGSTIYDYGTMVGSHSDDAGSAIPWRMVTRAEDEGDARVEKLYADWWLDANPNSNTLTPLILINLHTTSFATSPATLSGSSRAQTVLDDTGASSQIGVLNQTIGMDLSGTGTGMTLYQWQYSFVPKPEVTIGRPTDKTDDGYNGAKYVRGFSLEVSTQGPRKFNVLIDGVKATNPLTGNTIFIVDTSASLHTQQEIPVAIVPMVGQELQIAIDATDAFTLGWELFQIRWIWEKWPDLAQESSPIMNLGSDRAKYIRGGVLMMDSAGASTVQKAIFDVNASVTTYSLPAVSTAAGLKTPVAFAFDPPVIAHTIQFQPNQPCRSWYDEIVWDFEEWPELDQEYSNWIMPAGRSKPAYIRGFSMAADTNGVPVQFILRLENGTTIPIGSFTSVAGVKTVFPFVTLPNGVGISAVVSHAVRIEPQGNARCWYGEIVWDAEEYEELSAEESPILNCGYDRAKFMQGVVIPLDTNGQPVIFEFLNIDTGVVGYTSPPITTNGKQSIAFSWPPFIAHLVQIIPVGNARVFYKEASWVWEPTPELAITWTTPFMTHGMTGWLHQRLSWFAYLCTQAASLSRTFTDGTSETYSLPSTGGVYSKMFIPLTPKKSLAYQYSAICATGVKVYVNDCEFHTRSWGMEGPYSIQRPIGSPSVVQGAEI